MYHINVIFNYDGKIMTREYFSVSKIAYDLGSGVIEVIGEDIITHQFPLGVTFYLQGQDRSYTIDTTNLATFEIDVYN